jgi:hypothetical protein
MFILSELKLTKMKRSILTTALFLCTVFVVLGSYPGDPGDGGLSSGLLQDQHTLLVRNATVFDGTRRLSPAEVMNIFNATPRIAAQYDRAVRLRSSGVAMIVGGSVITIGGVVLMVNGIINTDDSSDDYGSQYYLGLLTTTVGELIVDGGIACSIVGKVKIRRSVSNYNAAMKQSGCMPQQVVYRFGLLNNGGIGLRVTF